MNQGRKFNNQELVHLISQINRGEVFTSEGLDLDGFKTFFPCLFHPTKEILRSIEEHKPVMFFEETKAAAGFVNGRPRFWSAYFMGEEDYLQLLKMRKQT